MKVLVTGGCGLIGFHLAKFYKSKDSHVVVIDNLERSDLLGYTVSEKRRLFNMRDLEERGVEIILDDVSKPSTFESLEGFDAIFHMAAQTSVPTSVNNPRRDFEINTIGTFNVLEHVRKTGGKLVYASTNKVYPLHDNWRFDKVRSRWRWERLEWDKCGFPVLNNFTGSRTPYGNSKYMGDLLCQEYYHMYGVPTGVFRMSCIFGTNQFSFEEQGWLTWMAIANLKDLPVNIFGDGNQVRDVLWVEDVVDAYDKYLKSNISHSIWNLGGGPDNTLSLNEAISAIEKITGKPFKVTYKDWRPSDQKVYTSDIRHVGHALNWSPTVTPLQGLEEIVDWAKEIIDVF